MSRERVTLGELNPKTTVVVATSNAHKVQEIEEILTAQALHLTKKLQFIPIGDIDLVNYTEPEETGETFLENARIKARAAFAATGFMCIADDSGFCVDALDGAPGVYSARYAGVHGDDVANRRKVLAQMEGVNERSARFVCAAVLISRENHVFAFEETCEGVVVEQERGLHGFGYDPIFSPFAASEHTMAELSAAQKNEISHRGKAFKALAQKMEELVSN